MSINFKIFQNQAGLKYGISEKTDEPMELANSDLAKAQNRAAFFKKQGIDNAKIFSPKLAHSFRVVKLDGADQNQVVENCDGLVTDQSDIFLTVTVADCFPVYLFNPATNTIGLIHSGWRGTVLNIAGSAVKAVGGNADDAFAGIGPGIQSCHFEIQDDVVGKFAAYPEFIIYRGNKIFVNLPEIIKNQLIGAGVKPQNIENLGECTFCQSDKYFSFRRDKPAKVQAIIAYIGNIK